MQLKPQTQNSNLSKEMKLFASNCISNNGVSGLRGKWKSAELQSLFKTQKPKICLFMQRLRQCIQALKHKAQQGSAQDSTYRSRTIQCDCGFLARPVSTLEQIGELSAVKEVKSFPIFQNVRQHLARMNSRIWSLSRLLQQATSRRVNSGTWLLWIKSDRLKFMV